MSLLKELSSVAAVCWLHSSPFPFPQWGAPSALQPHCFPSMPALPLRWLCLPCVDMSRRAQTVCCSVSTVLALLRPSGVAVISVIMDNRLGRDCWLDLLRDGSSQPWSEPGNCRAPPLPGMKPRAGCSQGAFLECSRGLIP